MPSLCGSTRNAVTPRCFCARSIEATTRKSPACAACEMKTLVPSRRQPPDDAPRGALQVAEVGAAARLGEAGRGQDLAARQARQPAILLGVAAVAQDRARDQRVGDRDDRRDHPVDARQLLADDPVGHDVAERAAVALGDHRRDVAERDQLLDQLESGSAPRARGARRAARSPSPRTRAPRGGPARCSSVRSKSAMRSSGALHGASGARASIAARRPRRAFPSLARPSEADVKKAKTLPAPQSQQERALSRQAEGEVQARPPPRQLRTPLDVSLASCKRRRCATSLAHCASARCEGRAARRQRVEPALHVREAATGRMAEASRSPSTDATLRSAMPKPPPSRCARLASAASRTRSGRSSASRRAFTTPGFRCASAPHGLVEHDLDQVRLELRSCTQKLHWTARASSSSDFGWSVPAPYFLREVEVDRHRLEEREVAVDERRDAAVRVDGEVVGLLRVRRAKFGLHAARRARRLPRAPRGSAARASSRCRRAGSWRCLLRGDRHSRATPRRSVSAAALRRLEVERDAEEGRAEDVRRVGPPRAAAATASAPRSTSSSAVARGEAQRVEHVPGGAALDLDQRRAASRARSRRPRRRTRARAAGTPRRASSGRARTPVGQRVGRELAHVPLGAEHGSR